jgi:hypothetical protein
MKTIRTPKGSPSPAIQHTFLGDPFGVDYSNDCVNLCPRASARGYCWSAPAGLGDCTEYGTIFASRGNYWLVGPFPLPFTRREIGSAYLIILRFEITTALEKQWAVMRSSHLDCCWAPSLGNSLFGPQGTPVGRCLADSMRARLAQPRAGNRNT